MERERERKNPIGNDFNIRRINNSMLKKAIKKIQQQ